MNLPLSHFVVGVLTIAVLYLLANRSAFYVLRRRNIPKDAAGVVRGILSAAFLIVYLFIGLIAYITLLSPQRAEIVRALLPPPSDTTFSAAASSPVPHPNKVPQGRMMAEQEQVSRQRLIAVMTDQLVRATVERHQDFTQEQPYVISEGISGTEDRYISPEAALAQAQSEPNTTSSMQKPLSFADEISAYFNGENPQAVQANPGLNQGSLNNTEGSTAIEQNKPFANNNSLPGTMPVNPIQQQAPPIQPVQTQPITENVSCDKIRMYMDNTDLQLFHRAMRQQKGVPISWKGPGSSYTVIPAARKGTCREYSMQANLPGRVLRCFAACLSIDEAIQQAAAASSIPQQQQQIPQQQAQDDEEVILHSMNSSDQDALIRALTYSGPVSWRSVSGTFYTVSPIRLGNPCREYRVRANIQGRPYEYIESNCR